MNRNDLLLAYDLLEKEANEIIDEASRVYAPENKDQLSSYTIYSLLRVENSRGKARDMLEYGGGKNATQTRHISRGRSRGEEAEGGAARVEALTIDGRAAWAGRGT